MSQAMYEESKLTNALKLFELVVTGKTNIIPLDDDHVGLFRDCLIFMYNPNEKGLERIADRRKAAAIK